MPATRAQLPDCAARVQLGLPRGGVLLHFFTGGCNGIGAWVVNSVLNCAILLPFLNFYHVVRMVALLDRSCSSVLRAGKEAHSNKLKSN